MRLENRYFPCKTLFQQLMDLCRQNGVGGVHGNQDAIDPQTVVAVLANGLIMFQKLRQSLCREKFRLCRHNDTVRTHHHVDHRRTHLGHTVDDNILIAVLNGINVPGKHTLSKIHVAKIAFQCKKLAVRRNDIHTAPGFQYVAFRFRQRLILNNFAEQSVDRDLQFVRVLYAIDNTGVSLTVKVDQGGLMTSFC